MSSRDGQIPRPYTTTPPGFRCSQNRASRYGQYQRPSTATPPGSGRTQDGRQDHNTKEDMEKMKKGFKEHDEKRANLLHQLPNNVDLRDVEEHLPKGELKTNKSELERYKRTNETLIQENNQLLSINKSLTEEIKCLTDLKQSLQNKELEIKAELERNKGKIKYLEQENSQLNSKNTSLTEERKHLNELKQSFLNREREQRENINRLNVEKEKLLKREREQSTKELENLRKDLNKIHEKERDQLLENIDRSNVENEELLKSKMECDEKQLFPVKSTDSLVPQKILVATGRAKRMVSDPADKISELEKMKKSQLELEQAYTDLKLECKVKADRHANEKEQLLNTIKTIEEEKEKFMKRELEEKHTWEIYVEELRAQHIKEKDQLLHTIGRLTVEKDNLLKR